MKYDLNSNNSTQMFLCRPKEDGSKMADEWVICDLEDIGKGIELLKGFATMVIPMNEVANLVTKHFLSEKG